MNMRVVFAIIAIFLLSTSAYAEHCKELPWSERQACWMRKPWFPAAYDRCSKLVDERGFRGAVLENPGLWPFFFTVHPRQATIGDAELPSICAGVTRRSVFGHTLVG
jgi:hypothetical protein